MILIINGSPRQKNTWAVVKKVKENLNNFEFEEINLYSLEIPFCKGCYNCFELGEEYCPNFSKIGPIADKIKKAKALIITSPVYALNVTGLIKNFIDHTAYFYHRPYFFNKKALVVSTTVGLGHKEVTKYLSETLRHWGFNKVYKIPIACGGNKKFDNKTNKKINKISEDFKKDIISNKLNSPGLKEIVFYNGWRFIASSVFATEKDKEYWRETGLLNHPFSPKVPLNPFKKLFGNLIFKLMKLFFK